MSDLPPTNTVDSLAAHVRQKAQGSTDCAFLMVVAEALQQRCDAIQRLTYDLKVQKGVNDLAYIPHRYLVEQNDRLRGRLEAAEKHVQLLTEQRDRLAPTKTGSTCHHLKTWPQFFAKVRDRSKPFELRKNDRDFKVGDTLSLEEWNPETQQYSGECEFCQIGYMLTGASDGIEPGYAVLGLRFAPEPAADDGAELLQEAWIKYRDLFGDDPHGTMQQLRALLVGLSVTKTPKPAEECPRTTYGNRCAFWPTCECGSSENGTGKVPTL